MTTLVVVAFPYATTAGAAAQDILLLEPDVAVDLDAIALISCNDRGQFQVTTNHRSLAGVSRGPFWVSLFTGLFFVPPSAVAGPAEVAGIHRRMTDAGLSPCFQTMVRQLIQPDTSAVFLIVQGVLPVEALEALGRFGGNVLAVPLRDDAETRILRAVLPLAG